jgi:large subunit ribosomal protein L29
MKANDLRKLTAEELQSKDRELAQELFNMKFQLHTGRLENTSKLEAIRKDMARVKTLIREKQS